MNKEERKIIQLPDEKLEQVTGGSAPVPEEDGGYLWPVPGFHGITASFGMRFGAMHNGIDISGEGILGASVEAAADGIVTCTSGGFGGGYGVHIIIDHQNGKSTVYAHLRDTVVNVGQNVHRGQVIGFVGDTGDTTGPCLYFETRMSGIAYDPLSEF